MRDGVTPTLKGARTAFSFPDVKAIGTASTCCRLRGLLPDGTFLSRRFCSASMAESNRSRSRSSSRPIALAKSLGKICRGDEVAVVALGIGDEGGVPGSKEAPGPEVSENRSRVVDRECAVHPADDASLGSARQHCSGLGHFHKKEPQTAARGALVGAVGDREGVGRRVASGSRQMLTATNDKARVHPASPIATVAVCDGTIAHVTLTQIGIASRLCKACFCVTLRSATRSKFFKRADFKGTDNGHDSTGRS
jgi:hypothetical protein